MSLMDVATLAISGGFDKFDVIRGFTEGIEKLIDEDIAER